MRLFKKLLSMLTASAVGAAVVCACAAPLCVSAEDNGMYLTGKVYEFDEKRDYSDLTYFYLDKTSELETLGQLSVSGEMTGTATDDNIAAFEVPQGENLVISYKYSSFLYRSDKFNWHITNDNATEILGQPLGGRIGSGAIVLLTSYDRTTWSLADVSLDITGFMSRNTETKTFETNPVQLVNGCYYKVVVAYKLEEQIDDTRFWFWDTSDIDRKRVAEVYEFYAGYNNGETGAGTDNGIRAELGSTVSVPYNGGYSGDSAIYPDDPHYGWDMGQFYAKGYTDRLDGNVFIKNPEDKLSLWFDMEQWNIDRLAGDSDLSVEDVRSASDYNFGLSFQNFGRGALIIRSTDPDLRQSEPVVMSDFLSSLAAPGSSTKVQLFDEGDYEVALDYRILKDGFFSDKHYDYRIFFTFSVRNSGCELNPVELLSELPLTSDRSEKGFRIDSTSSRYLNVTVKRTEYVREGDTYTKSTAFDRAYLPGEEYRDPGLYAVTAYNPVTDPGCFSPVSRTVYVGDDRIVIAYLNKANAGLTLNDIAAKVKDGATIDENGFITEPVKVEEPEDTSSEADSEPEKAKTAAVTMPESTEDLAIQITENEREERSFMTAMLIVFAAVAAAITTSAVIVYYQDREKNEMMKRKMRARRKK